MSFLCIIIERSAKQTMNTKKLLEFILRRKKKCNKRFSWWVFKVFCEHLLT